MTMMFYPIPLIDLPLSLVADTVFLPYDLCMVTLGGKTRYREDVRKTGQPAVRCAFGTRAERGFLSVSTLTLAQAR
jgi:hypothetical protein